jgi:hypothetical protein
MSAQEDHARTALIARICEAHRERDPAGPLVTVVDGAWAYCAGHRETEHEWRVIEPTQRQFVEEQIAAG